MAPPWVLLNRIVEFIDGGGFAGRAGKAGGSIRERSLKEALAAMKPHPVVADPPEVTCLSMLWKMPADESVRGGSISSTDRGLVVLYTGMYRPGSGANSFEGGYLVYDASSNFVSAIPQLGDSLTTGGRGPGLPTIKCLGASAAILRHRQGYVLAELVTRSHPGLPDAELYLWWSSSTANSDASDGAWMPRAASLPLPPELCGPTCFFHIDMAFSFEGSHICWVDLLTGILICDLFAPQGPEFSFVPLPQGHSLYRPHNVRLALKPREFRSMGCVSGAIKFVALVGYPEGSPKDQVVLKTWTLSHDLKEWKEGSALLVGDLWASESFSKMELPRVRPMFPVLSINEDDIICVFLNEIEYVDVANSVGQIIGRQLKLNGHYMLRVDLMQNKVLYSKRSITNSLSLLEPALLASDFSAYLHHSKDHQSEEEANKVGAIMKRIKY